MTKTSSVTPHCCCCHAEFEEHDYTETHGLDCGPYEHWHDEWFECSICHDTFTEGELRNLSSDQEDNACQECGSHPDEPHQPDCLAIAREMKGDADFDAYHESEDWISDHQS